MSRKVLIATHGHLADGFKSAAEILTGDASWVQTINAYTDEEPGDYTSRIVEFVDSIGPEDEGVIFTDLVGGSVNQKVVQTYDWDKPNVFVVSGTNLITLLGVLLEDRALSREVMVELTGFAKVELVEMTGNRLEEESDDDFFTERAKQDD